MDVDGCRVCVAAGKRPGAAGGTSGESIMSVLAIALDEFDEEMAATRRLIERVPDGKGAWKPHEKSFPLGHLAQLVTWIPGWITQSLTEPRLDLGRAAGYSFESTAALVRELDKNIASAREALQRVTGKALEEKWSLTHGDHVLYTAVRGPVVRQHLRHLAHHRGQLTVYLRLLDVPLPSIYGPTADEKWSA
jgi:uncharacterized damage-inducible protein DinB